MRQPRTSRAGRTARDPAGATRQAADIADIATVLPDNPAPAPPPKAEEDLPDDLRRMLEAAYT
jgi:hypothetical protein